MGMAASQARLLGLQARQSNLEYQGQQINQERTILSQQCTALYNSLLAMKVPTPPSTQDYTTIEYSGSDGATNFTIGTVKPSGELFNVEIKTTQTGGALQSDYGTKVVDKVNDNVPCTELTEGTKIQRNELGNFYVEKNGNVLQLNVHNAEQYGLIENDDGTYSLSTGGEYRYYKYDVNSDTNMTNANGGDTTVGGNIVYTFEEAQNVYGNKFSWDDYKTAITNTFGSNSEKPITADDFYVYVHTSDTGVESLKFALRSDVTGGDEGDIGDGFAKVYSFTPNGTYTSSTPIDGCMLQFDTQGRISSISIPQYDTNNKLIGYRDVDLTAKTTTDTAAYEDAYNQYEYAQYEYDKAQQDINHKTEVIQQEDRNLELKLQRLDNERTMIKTEIEAVEKVIQENIESSYKTFNG